MLKFQFNAIKLVPMRVNGLVQLLEIPGNKYININIFVDKITDIKIF